VEELLFRDHPEVVDADLSDYLHATSYCPLAHEVRSKSSGCRANRFDAESFLLAAHDTDGVELAAVDTLQYALA